MRKLFFTPLFSLLLMSLQAQEIAVTERGDSVVLYSNGTWDYYDNYRMDYRDQEGPVIPFSDKTYKKPGSANKGVKNNFLIPVIVL
jgi:predicted membrane-bound spermidine synthase